MSIVWREALATGNEIIDKDHQRLIELINCVMDALKANQPVGRLKGAMDDLDRYTREHFAREEEMMLARSYARYDSHKAAHLSLMGQLSVAAKPIYALNPDGSEVLAEEIKSGLVQLLRHWLLDHIIKEDLMLKPILH